MNPIQAMIAAALGAIGGYVVGKRLFVRALVKHDFKIHVTKTGATYTSHTTPQSERVKGLDVLVWIVNDRGGNSLPENSVVKLKFTKGSPLIVEEPNDGGNRIIISLAKLRQPRRPYPYKVYYSVGGEDFLLEDPELIMEGDR